MDKSSDSSSDSDSSSSTSWVFVEDTALTSSKAANTFHLDCSREPIQELTEQDLLSAGSDFESDTDGISVISESEIPTEDPCLNIQTVLSTNNPVIIEDKADHNDPDLIAACNDVDVPPDNEVLLPKDQHDKLLKMKPLHILGIGFVLTAVLLGCYSRITMKISKDHANLNDEDLPLYEEVDDVSSYKKVDLTSGDNAPTKICGTETDLNKDLEEIIDITMTCAFKYIPKYDIMDKQIKKCAKFKYNSKKNLESFAPHKKLEIKSKIVWNSDKRQREADDLREKIRLSNEIKEQRKCNKKDDAICKNKKPDSAHYKKKIEEGKHKIHGNGERKVIKLKLPKKKPIVEKETKNDQSRENYERLKKYKIHTYNKHQKDKNHDYKNKKQANDYKDKRDYIQMTDNYRNHDKYRNDVQKGLKDKNKGDFKRIPNNDEVKDDFELKVIWKDNRTAEWHSKLHKARSELRKQEHVSDWVFDRAYLRNKKRNKAQWYFKWMNIREQLRYKQSYKPYSS